MNVWTVANQKGGVGKTTTSVALAGIAAEQGLRVLMIDLDPHGSLTSYFKIALEDIEHSSFDLFDKRKQLSPAFIRGCEHATEYPEITLIPAVTALATLERQGIGDGMGLVLQKVFKLVNGDFDLVIVDCPPQLGVLMVNALAACDELVIPVQTEHLAIKGLERILNTLKMLYNSTKQHISHTIVPTMFDKRTQASVTSLRVIRNSFGENVWPAKISIDTRFRDASKAGVPPSMFDPDSRGVINYKSLYGFLRKKTHSAAALEQ